MCQPQHALAPIVVANAAHVNAAPDAAELNKQIKGRAPQTGVRVFLCVESARNDLNIWSILKPAKRLIKHSVEFMWKSRPCAT